MDSKIKKDFKSFREGKISSKDLEKRVLGYDKVQDRKLEAHEKHHAPKLRHSEYCASNMGLPCSCQ